MITGKPASEKVLERAQQVGMIILLALMAYTFGNDFYKLF
jgi:regulator of sigma E protease